MPPNNFFMPNAFQSDYLMRGVRWGGHAELPEITEGALVLETGCGNGKTLQALLSSGISAFGIDISKEAVRLCGCRDAAAADICHLPFKDESFDAVFCRHVLGHLTSSARGSAADELMRVVRSGGCIYVSVFGKDDFRFGKGTLTESDSFLRGDGIVTHYFTADELSRYFSGGAASSVREKRWSLRVRGAEYPRCEIEGVFLR